MKEETRETDLCVCGSIRWLHDKFRCPAPAPDGTRHYFMPHPQPGKANLDIETLSSSLERLEP